MIQLGISAFYHDSAACIVKDGKVISAAEEERFSRIKHTSSFPVQSINFCLKEAEINISDLDIITLNSNPFSSLDKKILFTLKNFKRYILAIKSISNIKQKIILNYLTA